MDERMRKMKMAQGAQWIEVNPMSRTRGKKFSILFPIQPVVHW